MSAPEGRIPRAQARREMAISAAVLALVVGIVFGQTIVLDAMAWIGPYGATAILVVGAYVLYRLRGRRGAGWAIARGTLLAFAIAMAVIVFFIGVCVATQCVR